MPIRLPTRRKAGEGKVPFRRRAPPTPQATRLMRVSLLAGVVLVVVLGIVFIPTALRYNEVHPPVIAMSWTGTGPFNVTVSSVSLAYPLADYRAELNVSGGGAPYDARLGPDLTAGPWFVAGGRVTFADADANGALSVGDAFTIDRAPGTGVSYRLLVFFKPDEGAGPLCPCAAGRIAWTP